MPVPYSDNLYSADDDLSDAEDNHTELSPTDGYFHASSPFNVASPPQTATSDYYQAAHLNVPIVPNVLVEDPTLREQDPNAKAREAAEERRLNPSAFHDGGSPNVAPAPSSSRPSRGYPSLPLHRHRQSVEEQYNTPTPGSGHTYSASSASHSTHRPQPPLIHHGEAPPAYSPSSPTSPPSAGGYQTFGAAFRPSDTMGHPEEEHASLLHRDPESMGGPLNGGTRRPWWSRAREAWQQRQSRQMRKGITRLLGLLVILAIIIVIISAVDPGDKERNGIDPSRPGSGHIQPPEGNMKWNPLKECYNTPYRYISFGTQFEFNPEQKLQVIENSEDRDEDGSNTWIPNVTGEVVIKPIEFPLTGEVDIEVLTNHKGLYIVADADRDGGRVLMQTPRRVKRDGLDQPPCIQIRITIRVPPGSTVEGAEISLTHLDLNILEGLDLNVSGETKLSTIVGNIKVPTTEDKNELVKPAYQLNSRDIYVKTMSGDIEGSYPLYDRLKLESISGDISIKAEPKPVDPKNPKPAELSIKTMSGNLRVKEPIEPALSSPDPEIFPSRDYSVAIETKSGDVTADLAFTSYGRFYSISGNLDVSLWPVLHDAQQSTIIGPEVATDTKSGETTLDLHEPHWAATGSAARLPAYPSSPSWIGYPPLIGNPTRDEEEHEDETQTDSVESSGSRGARPLTLYSSHSSVSGDIHLRYPSAWEGYLKAQTISGNQRYHGKGLQVERKGKLPLSILEGYKGKEGQSDLRVESISGNQDFIVGE